MKIVKFCNTCKLEKSLNSFYKCSKCPDGLGYKCISCCKIYDKKYKNENREKINKQNKDRYYLKYEDRKKYRISSFDKNTPPNIVNTLENLQPLWAKDNLRKGYKIT